MRLKCVNICSYTFTVVKTHWWRSVPFTWFRIVNLEQICLICYHLICVFNLFPIRNSSWPAKTDLCWQATGRWTYFVWLQHSKGLFGGKQPVKYKYMSYYWEFWPVFKSREKSIQLAIVSPVIPASALEKRCYSSLHFGFLHIASHDVI